ncbi:peptide deformylase [Lacimonas salitolerans]|uniref:Peptide deformylase n=1 Tax=Lacimonas salitolerans TaxID=1323750 RepID=A0ABW4E9T0_9RHOB
MSLLEILRWPDPRLSQTCDPVASGEDVEQLVTDMFETMYDALGRGLAAPQVGVMKRLFVMDCGWKDGDMTPVVCINPQIIEASDQASTGDEGCLSIPGVLAAVSRPEWIVLRWTDLTGTVQEQRFDGFEARCAQHEFDHLDGRVTFDRLDAQTRAALEAEYLA